MNIRCNICDQSINFSEVQQHIASRNHAVKRKVAEFQEMNALVGSSYKNDTSVIGAWIKDLYKYDFLSICRT